jgi:hypothetical protein
LLPGAHVRPTSSRSSTIYDLIELAGPRFASAIASRFPEVDDIANGPKKYMGA